MQQQPRTYREETRAPGWLVTGICLLALGPLWSASRLELTAGESSTYFQAGLLVLCAAALIGIAAVFSRLHVQVADRTLRFHFGPFGRTLAASDVRTATVEAYRAWSFGGWGIRLGYAAGQATWAYTVPFLRSGVAVTTTGRRYYLSSQTPARLAQAIEQLAREGHA